jgi:FtsP/CotA-like multicopper oxidase with cupredoxin domain
VKALRRLAFVLLAAGLVALLGWLGWMWNESRLPGRYNAMDFHVADYGGGSPRMVGNDIPVEQLVGPKSGTPDARFTLTAEKQTVRLSSGRKIRAWTFNGGIPGPTLRVHRLDFVEVTLVNKDIGDGVTIHWHGVDVPNREDGVAGVTQNAVRPGESYTYRFLATQVGTFWYHSHQISSKQVARGLYGAFVILPERERKPNGADLTVVAHTFAGTKTLGYHDTLWLRTVKPGTPARLRLVNTDSLPQRFTVNGAFYKVLAIDGTDLNGPTPANESTQKTLELGAGARYDVGFTMPSRVVSLNIVGSRKAMLALTPRAGANLPAVSGGPVFYPGDYGSPGPTPFDASTRFDRVFDVSIGRKLGFRDGRPGFQWTVNGKIYPDTPMLVVHRGELVKMTLRNDTSAVHPMHLHGHHVLVLSRNGKPVTGSPWWVDTLNMHAHERYEIAFRASNPGIWMDHCHNLKHAAQGLTFHLVYDQVMTTPFQLGKAAHNKPE